MKTEQDKKGWRDYVTYERRQAVGGRNACKSKR